MALQLPAFQAVRIDKLEVREDISETDFLREARMRAGRTPSVVLLSGGESRASGENRYSIAGWDPFLVFRSKGHACTLERAGKMQQVEADPLVLLDRLCSSFRPDFGFDVSPFSGGAMGYLAYDLKNTIERLPQTAQDDMNLPDLFLLWPKRIMVHDRREQKLFNFTLGFEGDVRGEGHGCGGHETVPFPPLRAGNLRSDFTHEQYLAAVGKVRRYIRRGDVYQVNLSQRFRFSFEGDPFRLWTLLFEMNPAPFYAFVNAGDHGVLSTSMERFLFRRGSYLETRPIKGTQRRGATPEEDAALASGLVGSPKDDAELSMIVDLMRNDLGRVCSPQTVRVDEHKRLESYQNVHHLVSIVSGRLRPEASYGDVLRACFPGGSITGCPKIRAMEIIDELEPHVRHVYTGSIGYLGWHENMDLNVAIRTAILKDGTCCFPVGGGIVYDSREEDEYRETLQKGRTVFDLVEKLGGEA